MRFGDLMLYVVVGLALEAGAGLLLAWDDALLTMALVIAGLGGLLLSIGLVSISVLFALRVHAEETGGRTRIALDAKAHSDRLRG